MAAAASESGHPAIKKAKVEGQSATPQPSESEESEDEDDDLMAAAPGRLSNTFFSVCTFLNKNRKEMIRFWENTGFDIHENLILGYKGHEESA